MTHQMITPPLPAPPSTGLPDVLTALATAGWYALPDYTRSRAARGAVKTGILLANAAYGSRVVKRRPPPAQDGRPPAETPAPAADDVPRRTPAPLRRLAVLGAAAVAVGSIAAVTVGMERLVHGFGERLSDRGVRLPHTRVGVALGVLSLAATLAGDALRDRRRTPAGDSTDAEQ